MRDSTLGYIHAQEVAILVKEVRQSRDHALRNTAIRTTISQRRHPLGCFQDHLGVHQSNRNDRKPLLLDRATCDPAHRRMGFPVNDPCRESRIRSRERHGRHLHTADSPRSLRRTTDRRCADASPPAHWASDVPFRAFLGITGKSGSSLRSFILSDIARCAPYTRTS